MAKKKKSGSQFNLINLLILLAYGFVAVLVPNLKALDSNGTKFLALALLNLLVFSFLFYNAKQKNEFSFFTYIFKTKVGIAYSLIILLSLLSFFKAINVSESIVHFSKIFTTFTATWLISIILIKDINCLKYLATIMTIFLVYDSLRVFIGVNDYISGNLESYKLLKLGYSNKNSLAAAIFIKIPFALWIFYNNKKWLYHLGVLSLITGILATLFLGTRAFYLGLIFIISFYIFIVGILNYKKLVNHAKKQLLTFLIVVLIPIAIFTIVQKYFYPDDTIKYNKSIARQLETISIGDAGTNSRLESWRWSTDFIKDNPILGIGLGNWKLRILERENLKKHNFRYKYKAHNDFFETAAEIGILGGLLFISIFAFLILTFVFTVLKKERPEKIKYYFLPAFGLIAYFFDAFFNFPQDRPEIQSLFALYLGMGIAFSYKFSERKKLNNENQNLQTIENPEKKWIQIIPIFGIIVLLGSIYILILNYQSLKLQSINWSEANHNKQLITYAEFEKKIPSIPNISVVGEPIVVLKSRKLFGEKKYDKILKILKEDDSSPYDSRPEYYASLAHYHLNNNDSALYYLQKAYKLKPNYYNYSIHYANILVKYNKPNEAIAILDTFIINKKSNIGSRKFISNKAISKIWKYNASLNNKVGNIKEASALIDSALVYFPYDSTLVKLAAHYKRKLLQTNIPSLLDANTYYNNKNYVEAVKAFELSDKDYSKFSNKESYILFLNKWAHSYFNLNNFKKSEDIFTRSVEIDSKNYYALMNLGIIQFQYKNYKKANEYFLKCLQSEKPNLFLTYKNLGTSYLILNKNDEAIESYENALKYDSAPDILRNLNILSIRKGNTEKATYYKNLLDKK